MDFICEWPPPNPRNGPVGQEVADEASGFLPGVI
jgi:hypothetical protein